MSAEEGMTFGEWAQSKYNYDGRHLYYDLQDECHTPMVRPGSYFNLSDAQVVIEDGKDYSYLEDPIGVCL